MRRVVCLLLAVCVFLVGIPASAFGVVYCDPPQAAEAMTVYGYTNEGVTVGDLALDLGVSNREALALCMVVDSWTISGPFQRYSASQLANVASGAHTYMTDHATWDSFADWAAGGLEIAGGILFDMRPWYDVLGFSSLAEEPTFGVTEYGGRTYTSGLISMPMGAPAYPMAVHPTWSEGVVTAAWRLGADAGYQLKASCTSFSPYTVGDYHERISASGTVYFICANCGWTGQASIFGEMLAFTLPDEIRAHGDIYSALFHAAGCDSGSEAATVVKALVGAGLPGWALLSAAAASNPGGVALASVDAWGIPGYLPPGAIHDELDFAEGWGDGISSAADDLASLVASLPAGFAEFAAPFVELMRWVGDFFKNAQAWVISMFTPTDDFLAVVWPSAIEDIAEDAKTRWPFAVLKLADDLRAVFY